MPRGKSACRFCEIVAAPETVHVVLEDARFLAFLDKRPLFPGHTLLLPKAHHETLVDLPDALVEPLFLWTRALAGAMESALGAAGSFVAMNNRVSQSVPHLHVHVVPRRPKDGLRGFFWPRQTYESETEMAKVAARLRHALSG